jgi:hypothetical protein
VILVAVGGQGEGCLDDRRAGEGKASPALIDLSNAHPEEASEVSLVLDPVECTSYRRH